MKFQVGTQLERALLSRALNTELNAIAKLIHSDSGVDATFREQYQAVFGMWDTVYPNDNNDTFFGRKDTWETDLNNRLGRETDIDHNMMIAGDTVD